MGYPDSAQAGSNLFQMAGNMDSAQGSAEQWQVNNGGFGPGPVRPPFYHEAHKQPVSRLGSALLSLFTSHLKMFVSLKKFLVTRFVLI